MTDSSPFVPPVARPDISPPSAPLPPPTGEPRPGEAPGFSPLAAPPPPPVPPSAPTPQWVRGLILAGIVIGAVAIMGAVAFLVDAVRSATTALPAPVADVAEVDPPGQPQGSVVIEPLLEGDPGRPVAAEPLDCTGCFDLADAESLRLPERAYAELGVPESDGETWKTKVYSEQLASIRAWREDGGSPEGCYLTYPWAPLPVVAEPVPTAVRLQDLYFPEWHFDASDSHMLTEIVRVFDSSTNATGHLAEVDAARAACPGYTMTEANYSGVVTAAPALVDLPPSVAATGWVEQSGSWRKYAFDLQRGNLVVRIVLTTNGPGPTEAGFRDLVDEYAVLLSELEP